MKIEYAISIDDFRALQRPFSLRAGASAGFKGTVVACAVIAVLGTYCLIEGFGLSVGGFLISLAAVAGVAAYFYDVRSIRRAKEKYDRDIAVAYERLHCRHHRIVETSQSGFTLTCNCGTGTRPWSKLVQFAENDRFFQLRTKTDGLLLPKSAFASEGDKTEFRRTATEQINGTRPFASRPTEFVSTTSDYWSARRPHILRGGGWRRLAPATLLLVGAACVLGLFHEAPPQNAAEGFVAIEMAIIFVLVAFFALLFIRGQKRRALYRIPLRLYFGEEGLHLQDPMTTSKNPWENFCGYLENRSIFLPYHNASLYRIIPKRGLGSREAEFRELLQRKVSPFD